ncbi:MAG: LysR substrate-binding domain-containing protein [Steroidobacteraceae bacterium]
MNIQHLRYALAIARNELSVTQAAQVLGTSQPAISRALKALETELGCEIFARQGRSLAHITPAGERALEIAARAIDEIDALRVMTADLKGDMSGKLSIATTHTQARYVLPPIVKAFRRRYPEVELHLHQGTSEQIADLVATDRAQLAIATGSEGLFGGLVLLPVYRWQRHVIVPRRHPLTKVGKLSITELARHPLITYVFSFSGPSSLHEIFARHGLRPRVAITARDADVIKTYVRLGLGVGIVASVALEAQVDADLAVIDAAHLFPIHTTWVGFRQGTVLRRFTYDFLALFGEHLTPRLVNRAQQLRDANDRNELFRRIALPVR